MDEKKSYEELEAEVARYKALIVGTPGVSTAETDIVEMISKADALKRGIEYIRGAVDIENDEALIVLLQSDLEMAADEVGDFLIAFRSRRARDRETHGTDG